MKATPEEYLPLTPTVFEILVSLAAENRHGYAVITDVAKRTDGRVRLRPGSLYRAMHRLLDQGLVAELDERPSDHDERRRYYRITDLGRRVAVAEAHRLADALRGARASALIEPEEILG